jgi:hypothetical protein
MNILQFPAKELTLRQQTIIGLHTYSLVQLNMSALLAERKNDFELVAIIDAHILRKCEEFNPANTLKRVKKLRQTLTGGE